MIRVRRALLSVYDKRGLVEFARALSGRGVEILSTGGTAQALAEAGVPVRKISELTGFPEILDGRVKSLHPAIHAGILARREVAAHLEQLERLGLVPIDLVAVNLYPFEQARDRLALDPQGLMEWVDIGGPAMLRAAAKNHAGVVALCGPEQYPLVLEELERWGGIRPETARRLAVEAFALTAAYDRAVAAYLREVARAGAAGAGLAAGAGAEGPPTPLPTQHPSELLGDLQLWQELRYGENPHQPAAAWREAGPVYPSIPFARQLQGKPLSYNNVLDASAALEAAIDLWLGVAAEGRPDPDGEGRGGQSVAVAVKHQVPCGAAVAAIPALAVRKAKEADPESIFGGIVAVSQPVDADTAEELASIFLEVVLAPSFSPEARQVLGRKTNLRLLEVGEFAPRRPYTELRRIPGGLVTQAADVGEAAGPEKWKPVTEAARRLDGRRLGALAFAWRVAKHVRSNAIVLAAPLEGSEQPGNGLPSGTVPNGHPAGSSTGYVTVGIGGGQTSRIRAARIALQQAGDRARGAVMASDGFFPFPDVVEEAAAAGVAAIVQPGGSVRDALSVEAAERAGIALFFTGVRHFRH